MTLLCVMPPIRQGQHPESTIQILNQNAMMCHLCEFVCSEVNVLNIYMVIVLCW